MRARCGEQEGQKLAELMEEEYRVLYAAYENRPEALQNHLHNNIFPVVTAFHSLIALGRTREEAARETEEAFLALMDDIAQTIRKAMRFPGLHRIMPRLFRVLMPKLFREDAGFRFRMYDKGPHHARFDMLECPYFQICKELDCEDIAPIFCATDDTCYGNMHPDLIWNRTKTMARGGDLCDFDLYLREK